MVTESLSSSLAPRESFDPEIDRHCEVSSSVEREHSYLFDAIAVSLAHSTNVNNILILG